MKKFFILSMFAFCTLNADWIYEDDNGDKHLMKDPAPSAPKEEAVFVNSTYPFPGTICNILCGKFYLSTDDPSVWIEINDEDIGLEEICIQILEEDLIS